MIAPTVSSAAERRPPESTGEVQLHHHKSLAERRIGIIRFGGLFGTAVTGFYFVYNIVRSVFFGFPLNRAEMGIEIVFVALFLLATFAARRYRFAASYLIPTLVCAICLVITSLFGKQGSVHMFLLTVGPISALIFNVRRLPISLAWCALAALLNIAIQFLFPQMIEPGTPLVEQIADPVTAFASLQQFQINYIINVIAIEFGLTLCTYFAMRWATSAEQAMMREYARSEMLLQNLLPASIATRLKDNPGGVIADQFDSISILFADVVNFTPASARKRPGETVAFLSRLFGEFDLLAEKHGLEKIKTIGDAYMVAGGMPEHADGHEQAMADMALDMIAVSETLMAAFDEQLSMRIGLHVGPAIAGVIGHNKPYYDVWGDTINVAARMEAFGVPGRIQITPEVRDILGNHYSFENRGLIDIKGKGPMDLYFLVGKSAAT